MSAHRHRWRDLLPGLAALAACLAAAAFVLIYARVGALRGDTFPLVVVGGSAEELLQGTEVWLAGQRIGQIRAVEFRPPSVDTSARIAIRVRVFEHARSLLRSDSDARIAAGGSLLGGSVLALTPGTVAGQPLRDGDTLYMRPATDYGALVSRVTSEAQIEELGRSVRAVTALAAGTRGTVGALLGDSTAPRTLTNLSSSLGALSRRATQGRSTIGGYFQDGERERRIERVMARADSLQRLLESSEGTLGRFRRDSTLLLAIDEVRGELDVLRVQLSSPSGTIGRARVDGIVEQQLDSVAAALSALSRDVRRRPFRYLVF